MTRTTKNFALLIIVAWISLFTVVPAAAIPSLPASFYGMVKVNAMNVFDGTVVQALIGEQVFAEGRTQTYQGDSVFAIDVPGDDPETTPQDGGRDGDIIQFKIGEVFAEQTGTWHSGTNVNLDLTGSSAEPIDTPEPTPTSVPSQTPVVLPQSVSNPTNTVQASATSMPTIPVEMSPAPTLTNTAPNSLPSVELTEPLQTEAQANQPESPTTTQIASTLVPPPQDQDNDPGSRSISMIGILLLLLAVGASILFWYFRKS